MRERRPLGGRRASPETELLAALSNMADQPPRVPRGLQQRREEHSRHGDEDAVGHGEQRKQVHGPRATAEGLHETVPLHQRRVDKEAFGW